MVVIVALVVMGPKDLPKMLRRVGQWAGKIRRAAADLRAQSGIDDALRSEGLADDIAEIRKLARGELDAVRQVAQVNLNDDATVEGGRPIPQEHYGRGDDFYVVRDREYPRDGADAYGSLPDNAILYSDTLPKSKLARDALYRMGDENAELPNDPTPPPPAGATGPTLMGIGAAELEAQEKAKADAAPETTPSEEPATASAEPTAASHEPTPQEPAAIATLVGVAGLPAPSSPSTNDTSEDAAVAAAKRAAAESEAR